MAPKAMSFAGLRVRMLSFLTILTLLFAQKGMNIDPHVEGATPRAVETVVNHLQAVTGATERVTIQIDTTLQLLEFQSKVSKLLHKNIARSNPQPLFIAG
eukprot:1244568-Amorphochlora_amoeboformis.AAC.1